MLTVCSQQRACVCACVRVCVCVCESVCVRTCVVCALVCCTCPGNILFCPQNGSPRLQKPYLHAMQPRPNKNEGRLCGLALLAATAVLKASDIGLAFRRDCCLGASFN